ncbi:hypothetical protein B0H63DRAFT_518680 [Podospora didyma]|uniref:Uncharacterized protein n=1 Tax=Podospora didyma TaxID=330526 RepID=A0AAE0U3F1_9PEZI|nr:hypothetical protein B0H63DRAFT_518680 [Podospora didyma]
MVHSIIAFGLLALAATSIATSESLLRTITSLDSLYPQFATASPIRTVVTVNSNRIDVLASDKQDVPKVLEKLRQLCAGPYASLYPEICEHLEAGGIQDGDSIMWWPTDDDTPDILTTVNWNVDDMLPSQLTSLGSTAPQETGSGDETSSSASQVPPLEAPSTSGIRTDLLGDGITKTSEGETGSFDKATEANIASQPTVSSVLVPTPVSTTLETRTRELSLEEVKSAQSSQTSDETPPDCPWKKTDSEGATLEQGCTVITIWNHPTRRRYDIILGPTLNPNPLPSASITPAPLPSPSFSPSPTRSAWISENLIYASTPGCTQTIRRLVKMRDFYTSTIFPGTVTATSFVKCICLNLKLEVIGGPGIVINPKTTVRAAEPMTTTTMLCGPT